MCIARLQASITKESIMSFDFKQARQKLGYTVPQLAKLLDVDESTVYRWEQKIQKPSLEPFLKLQKLLGK